MRIVKVLLLCAMTLCVVVSVASAADVIGTIEPQRIMFNHPKFENVRKRIQTIYDAKQTEAKAGIEKATDNQKKAEIFSAKKQEAAAEEQKLMAPLFKEIDAAIRTVARNKKITIVVDKTSVFFGGLDITDDVIQELKRSASK